MENKNKSIGASFRHAFDGLAGAVKNERNMKIHVVMTVLVAVCSVIFGLTSAEKAAVFICCGVVMCAELFNTAIEIVVDICSPGYSEAAKKAKDTAAAAVLIISMVSAAVGLIVFVPYAGHIVDFIQRLI